jgi:hypothetical protein
MVPAAAQGVLCRGDPTAVMSLGRLSPIPMGNTFKSLYSFVQHNL